MKWSKIIILLINILIHKSRQKFEFAQEARKVKDDLKRKKEVMLEQYEKLMKNGKLSVNINIHLIKSSSNTNLTIYNRKKTSISNSLVPRSYLFLRKLQVISIPTLTQMLISINWIMISRQMRQKPM